MLRSILQILLPLVCSGILVFVSLFTKEEVPEPLNNAKWTKELYTEVLYPYRVRIAMTAAILQILIAVYFTCTEASRRKPIAALLQHFLDEHTDGDISQHRVTIFRKRRYPAAFVSHIFQCLLQHLYKHIKKGCVLFYLKSFPRPFRPYLMQYCRRGQPYQDGTTTKFLVARNESEISGIAAKAFFNEKPETIQLPDFSNLDVHSIAHPHEITDLSIKTKVDEYMRLGKIQSFEHLKSFHRFPTLIWASPITGKGDSLWGVIVFDSICCDGTEDKIIESTKRMRSVCKGIGNLLRH